MFLGFSSSNALIVLTGISGGWLGSPEASIATWSLLTQCLSLPPGDLRRKLLVLPIVWCSAEADEVRTRRDELITVRPAWLL